MDEGTPEERVVLGYKKPEDSGALPAKVQGGLADCTNLFLEGLRSGSNEIIFGALVKFLRVVVPDLTEDEAGLIVGQDTDAKDQETGEAVPNFFQGLVDYLGFGDTPFLQGLLDGASQQGPTTTTAGSTSAMLRAIADQIDSTQPTSSETPPSEVTGPEPVTASS